MTEFSTHMVYFSHSHVCVKCRKRARNFLGGGCALIKAFWTVSQWVNASQIAFNTNISPTHTPCKIVESRRDLRFFIFFFGEKGKAGSCDKYAVLQVRWYEFVRQVLGSQEVSEIVKDMSSQGNNVEYRVFWRVSSLLVLSLLEKDRKIVQVELM